MIGSRRDEIGEDRTFDEGVSVPYAVIARYRVAPEDTAVVRAALEKMRTHTVQEPANLLYILHTDPTDPAIFTIYEQYADETGFETHKNTPHFAEHILGTIFPRLADRVVNFGRVLD
ncbi:putative quinol monooxygenase [Nocardia sp. BMG111209]|uniref:putative quinol monooxygenase n=1 Tax=Nocardia sp. BMG111209 TaxID=1160137 RepID=UPI0003746BE1|nr:putative quinol monooxygenase [Nocardia sp. BMG111209]